MASVTPKLHILNYEYVDNLMEKRKPYHEARAAYIEKQAASGNVILGGAIDHPPTAALTILRNLTAKEIEEIVNQDPYVINGLVTKYTIKPFLATIGDSSLQDDLVKI